MRAIIRATCRGGTDVKITTLSGFPAIISSFLTEWCNRTAQNKEYKIHAGYDLIERDGRTSSSGLAWFGLIRPTSAQDRRTLFHPGNGGFDRVNIRPQVPPIGSSACSGGDLGAARPFFVAEPWIFTNAVLEVADAGRFRRSDNDVSFGKGPTPADDQVLIEFIWIKTGLQNGFST
jgi:hypothetical protein